MKVKRKKKRMKKNHVRVPFPVVLANILVLVAVLGLSYMWLCSRCDALGREIKRKEAELGEAHRRYVTEQDVWSSMTSPANLERAIRKHKLDMIMPRERQVIRVNYQSGTPAAALALNQAKGLPPMGD